MRTARQLITALITARVNGHAHKSKELAGENGDERLWCRVGTTLSLINSNAIISTSAQSPSDMTAATTLLLLLL